MSLETVVVSFRSCSGSEGASWKMTERIGLWVRFKKGPSYPFRANFIAKQPFY